MLYNSDTCGDELIKDYKNIKQSKLLLVPTALGKAGALYIYMKSRKQDFSGLKFSRLTVISNAPDRKEPSGRTVRRVIVKCDCGIEKDVSWKNLKSGKIRSCGCLAEDQKTVMFIGQVFSNWTLIEETEGYFSKNGEKQNRAFICQCVCGRKKEVIASTLRNG